MESATHPLIPTQNKTTDSSMTDKIHPEGSAHVDQISDGSSGTQVHHARTPTANTDLHLSWKDVNYSIPLKKKETKTLLENMNGSISSGQVVGIMGGSGAGKSTLLNVLAGRIADAGTLSGEIKVNNSPRSAKTWRKLCAYVEQDDILYPNLTVLETLTYSALLRLPSKLSKKEKMERVHEVIMDLGLDGCKETKIGDSITRGISGGERKRVSIGVELVSQPKLLFLDEPTSGLDAFNAFNVIDNLKNLAVKQNKAVLMTIHQPRTDILELFDKIILLSAGKLIFFGTTDDCLDHFQNQGFPIPPKTNPSDFFLDTITLDQRTVGLKEASLARIEKFQKAWINVSKDLPVVTHKTDSDVTKGISKWPNSWFGEFSVLLRRNLTDVSRDKPTLGATLGQGIFIMLLMGFIFFKLTNDAQGVQNRLGLLFFIIVNQTFGIVMPTLGVFPTQRQINKRERAAGSYRASSAFIAKLISSFPLVIAGSLLLSLPVYWMTGLQPVAEKYLTFILIVGLHSLTANALGLMIGSGVPTVQVGQIVGPLIIVIFFLFGGLFVNLDKVPEVFKWIQYISIISYSNKALCQNEFTGLALTCDQGPGPCYANGEAVLDTFELTSPTLWICLIINVAIMAGFLLIGFGLFKKTSAPLLRLK